MAAIPGPACEAPGRVLLVGFGAIGRCLLPMLVERLGLGPGSLGILDGDDQRALAAEWIERGFVYEVERLVEGRLEATLAPRVVPGDLLVNVTVGVDSVELASWCHRHGVLYVDSSIEVWDEEAFDFHLPAAARTEYVQHQRARGGAWRNDGPTAVICHGANPGLVSHFTKAALLDVAAAMGLAREATPDSREGWARLARATGTRVIHVSERDTQAASAPRKPGEFVNTWSVPGFLEEACMPVELGWGTHERTIPEGASHHETGPRNAIYWPRTAGRTWCRSWVPLGGSFTGLALPHSESVTISDLLTSVDGGGAAYRPTVLFVYLPCDAATASLHETIMRDWREPADVRILADDIVDGRDELGVLLLGHGLGGWWYGSQLDIHEARRLAPGHNATAVQVAAGLLAAVLWAIGNPRRGFCEPEDLAHDFVLEVARPYLGQMQSRPTDWTPLLGRRTPFAEPWLRPDDPWQFHNFLAHE